VREALDDDGDLVGREALVGHDLVVGRVVEQAGALLDGALEGVFGHRRLLRLLDGEAEAGVAGWVRTTRLRCDDDLFSELAERAALGVCALLATLLLPLSTHGAVLARLDLGASRAEAENAGRGRLPPEAWLLRGRHAFLGDGAQGGLRRRRRPARGRARLLRAGVLRRRIRGPRPAERLS